MAGAEVRAYGLGYELGARIRGEGGRVPPSPPPMPYGVVSVFGLAFTGVSGVLLGVLLTRGATLVPRSPIAAVALVALLGVELLPGKAAATAGDRLKPRPWRDRGLRPWRSAAVAVVVTAALAATCADHQRPTLFAGTAVFAVAGMTGRWGLWAIGWWGGLALVVVALPLVLETPHSLLTAGPVDASVVAGDAVRLFVAGLLWFLLRALLERQLQAQVSAREAVEAERTRIARELHDVVAHQMSVVVVQAQAAAAVLDDNPGAAARALGSIETTTREALVELRRMLGVLRPDDAAERRPQPSLHGLEPLVGTFRDAGLDVRLAVSGSAEALPPGVGLSAYRIVQEALTNALRHAGPTGVDVNVEIAPDHVDIDVVDDGPASNGRRPDVVGSGQGIVGMRERVAVLGGTLSTGPRTGRGWGVAAHLPVVSEVAG